MLVTVLLLNACEKNPEPTSLVGRWQMIAVQNTSGSWEDAPLDILMLQIYADGQIAYFDKEGNRVDDCCAPVRYSMTDRRVTFSEWISCRSVRCAITSYWDIILVDAQLLEVKPNNSDRQLRYKRVG